MEYCLGYREVIPNQTATEKWTEFSLNTGGTQSTLQDIKVTERSNGYSYKDQSKYYTRNRYIYWRISHDVLELVEQSLDVNLIGNRIRYKFVNTPVLEGITIHEVFNSVVVLVATVSSAHRLSFPHPDTIHNQEHVFPRLGTEYSAKSIFAEATINDAKNPASFYVINNTCSVTDAPFPHTSATGLSCSQQHFYFALAYNAGIILLIKFDAITGNSTCTELKHHYDALMMPRFLSRAFRGKNNKDEVAVSMLFQEIAYETYLFSLCRDGNIRLWSTSRKHCSIVTDLTPPGNQGTQDHMIRKAEGPQKNTFLIATFLCFASHSTVQILKPTIDNGSFHLHPVLSVYTPKDQDLVDFAITYSQEIWAVFRSPHGETSVSYCRGNYWTPCILENPLDSFEIPIDFDIEPKQNYIDFIFHPGRFPVAVINKALSIYRKSNVISDVGVPTRVLKERVCAVVDAQVNAELEDRDYSEEEVMDLINNCWQKFYSCCVEYYESGTRPIGLLLLAHNISQKNGNGEPSVENNIPMDTNQETDTESNESENCSNRDANGEIVTSGVVLIKKLYVSLIRPMDALESVVLNDEVSSEDFENGIEMFGEGVTKNLLKFIKILMYLDDNLPPSMKINFDKNLRLLKSPMAAVREILGDDMNMGEEDTLSNLDLMYNVAVNIDDEVVALMTTLLDCLDIGQPDLPDGYDKIENTKWLIHLGHLYGSQFATSFVVNSLQQIVSVRYELCRCLLIFQRLLSMDAFQQVVDLRKRIDIEDVILERTSMLTQCYYVLRWMTNTAIHPTQSLDSLENCSSTLNLNGTYKNIWIHSTSHQQNRNITILELFLQSMGSTLIRLLLSKREIPQSVICLWHHSLLPYIHVLAQLVWPVCNNTIFPEFLLSSSQYLHVQEYTRLLSKWCHSNCYTRKFLMACALLDSGEHYKAFDTFNKAAHGVGIDDFLTTKIIQTKDRLSRGRLTVLYYLKVIKLFEQHNLYDLIINLAKYAIEVSEKEDPELPTLYSIVFLNHLQVGQYKEAYESLIANPDGDRKKDCLRQLVVSLFDSRLLDTLMNFSFSGMQDDLERVIEGRARSLDVMNNDYYNFLYSFHSLKGSMRKAACVMYEQAFRLSLNSVETNLKILEKQCKCYIAAINSLNLVRQEDAWIVKPFLHEDDVDVIVHPVLKQYPSEQLKKQVEVLELSDIMKEYSLCKARLRLLKFSPEHLNKMSSTLSPHELIGVLTNVGFYKDALEICKKFNISPGSVLSGLAANCVRLDETHVNSAWEWLTENDISDLGDGTASNLAWRLLESFLKKYEEKGSSSLHKAVTNKLLQLGVFVPHWLMASYKLKNPSELLRLLLENGRLEESAQLALEYARAVLGQGKDRFNITSSMFPQSHTTWLPLNVFDMILLELEAHSKFDSEYKELHEELCEVLETYFKTAAAVSEDKIKAIRQATHSSAAQNLSSIK